jgi:hypothetical protein
MQRRIAATIGIAAGIGFALAAASCESSGPTVVRGSGVQNEPFRPAPVETPIGGDRPNRPTAIPDASPQPTPTPG